LGHLAEGKSYKEIADEMQRSAQTIYSHSKRMYRKLGVKSKTEAVVLYMQAHRQSPPA
jgi:DNA-binding CsgD family transcriptional regulator